MNRSCKLYRNFTEIFIFCADTLFIRLLLEGNDILPSFPQNTKVDERNPDGVYSRVLEYHSQGYFSSTCINRDQRVVPFRTSGKGCEPRTERF